MSDSTTAGLSKGQKKRLRQARQAEAAKQQNVVQSPLGANLAASLAQAKPIATPPVAKPTGPSPEEVEAKRLADEAARLKAEQEIQQARTAIEADLKTARTSLESAAGTVPKASLKPVQDIIDTLEKALAVAKTLPDLEKVAPAAKTALAKADRADQKATLLAESLRRANPPGATSAQLARIALARGLITTLPACPEAPQLAEGTKALEDLKQLLVAVSAEIAERKAADTAVAEARNALAAAAATLTDDLRTALEATLATVVKQLADATDLATLQAAKAAGTTFVVTAGAASAFGDEHARLIALKPVYDAATGNKVDATIAAAVVQAKAGKFTEALAALKAFQASTPTARGNTEVYAALKLFRGSPGGRRLKWLADTYPDIPGLTGMQGLLDAAKFTGLEKTPPDPAAAVVRINALTDQANAFAAYADKLVEIESLQQSDAYKALPPPAKAKVNKLTTDGRAKCVSGKPIEGRAELEKIAALPELALVQPYVKAAAAAEQLIGAVGTDLALAGTQYTIDTAAAARKLFTDGKIADATVAFNNLAPEVQAVMAYREANAIFNRAAARLDPTRVPALRAPADAAVAQGKFADATAAIKLATAPVADLVRYLDRRAQVDAANAAADATQQAAMEPFITRATKLAAEAKPAEALAALNELRQLDQVNALDAQCAEAMQRLAALKLAAANVAKMVTMPSEATALLTNLAVQPEQLLTAQHKPADALQLIEAAEKTLKDARLYKASWDGTRAAYEAIKASTVAKPANLIVNSDKAAGAALNLAKTGDFAKAAQAFDALRASLAVQSKAVATALEAADGGHSLAAHGKDTVTGSEDKQVRRLRTGKRPDDKTMKASVATNFESDADWLAARQIAANKLKATVGIDISSTVAPASGQTKVEVIVEHGRPIDRAAVGLREVKTMKQEGPNKGEVGGTTTYETFEIWTGLTRTRSNFIYEGGRWKLHQQFPHPDGWDNMNQRYTTPLPQVAFKAST